jgi:hypothetical protein
VLAGALDGRAYLLAWLGGTGKSTAALQADEEASQRSQVDRTAFRFMCGLTLPCQGAIVGEAAGM